MRRSECYIARRLANKSIQMQSYSEGTKRANDFSLSWFARTVSTKARSRLSPLWEVTSKKKSEAIERSYLETVGLLILPKSRRSLRRLLQWARASREIRRSGFGLRGRAKKEGTGSKASEMKIGERGRKEGRKKPGPKGARARERNAWELNHVVGRLAREISRCESARTHTETLHVRELYRYTWRWREQNRCTYVLCFEVTGNFRKNHARNN